MSEATISPRRAFEQQVSGVLACCDVLVCLAAMGAAYYLRLHAPATLLAPLRHAPELYVGAAPVVVGLWLLGFYLMDLYDIRRFQSPFAELLATFGGVTVATLLIAAASFLSHTDYSRAILILFWGAGLVLTIAERGAFALYRSRALRRGKGGSRTAIVGCGELGQVVAERIRRYRSLGYTPVGFVSTDHGPESVGGFPVLGRLDGLPEIIEEHNVDEVLVAQRDLDVDRLMTVISRCRELTVQFNLVAGPLQLLTTGAEISGLADLPVVPLERRHFPWWQAALKRAMDLVLSTMLLVLAAPLLVIMAVLIRRETGASAIFRQQRIGQDGAPFTMLKFRTMTPATEPYAPGPTNEDDERITRTGRWLRRYSLDELPQLINVLRGEMSLVGPRPEMAFIVEQYEPWQRRRLEAKPGLTGLWQILGRKDLPLRDNIEYDFYYINNRSLLMDLAILLRTVWAVARGRGAY
jgi:exopolysaccharide biosynthesis polyprenyl glycosylphosphotransferase